MCWITSLGHAAPPRRSRGGLKTTERGSGLKWMALPGCTTFIVVWKPLSRLSHGGQMWTKRGVPGSGDCSEPLRGGSFLPVGLLTAPHLPGDIFCVLLSQKNEMKNEVSLFCCCVSRFPSSHHNFENIRSWRREEQTRSVIFNLFCSLLGVYFLLVLQEHVKRFD